MKDTFIVYTSYLDKFAKLSDEQLGRLFRIMLEYQATGEVPVIDDMALSFCFDVVKYDMDENNRKYEEMCERQRANVQKRWEKRNTEDTMVYHGIPPYTTDTKHTDNDSDNDSESDSESDSVSDNSLRDKKRLEAKASKREIIEALVAKWNSYADRGSIPTIRSVSVDSKTGKSVLARVNEHGIEEVVEVMDMVFRSNYLRGFKNGWCAKFDWIFLPTNYEKILNGNYNERDVVQTQNDMIDTWIADYHARKGEVI